MMAEPYTIHFPINFTVSGDRTRQAVSKHIQEFAALASYTGDLIAALKTEIGESADDAWTFKVDGEEI
jgi:hypothetical protein